MKQNKNLIEHVFDVLKQSSFSIKNKTGALLAALTMVTGAVSLPVSAFGVVPTGLDSFGQTIEVDVKTAVAIAYPAPEAIGVSQGFYALHPGLDIRAPLGSEIKAVEPGTVALVATQRYGYGRHVIVDHGEGKTSLYAHMGKIFVEEGDLVTPETTLGEIGLTGRTTGPHLHLEIREEGRAINPLRDLASR